MPRIPDLHADLFEVDQARLVLGEDLVLVWSYQGSGPKRLEFEAREGDGTRLATLAVIPVNDHEYYVSGGVVAEVITATAAAARRAFPDHARQT